MREPLSVRAKVGLGGLGLVSVAIVGATAVALVRESRERLMEQETRELLEAERTTSPVREIVRQRAVIAGFGVFRGVSPRRDAWGRHLMYRWPGKKRSEVEIYSAGRNGIDEQGDGDDIVLGAE